MDRGEGTREAGEGTREVGEDTPTGGIGGEEGFETTTRGTWENSFGYAAPSVTSGGRLRTVFSTPRKRVGISLSQSEVTKGRTLLRTVSIAALVAASESSETDSRASW